MSRMPPLLPDSGPPYLLNPSSEGTVRVALLGAVLFDGVLDFNGMRSSSVPCGAFSKVANVGSLSAMGPPLAVGAAVRLSGGGDSARAPAWRV